MEKNWGDTPSATLKNIYILHSIYTFIPQKRIDFSNSNFIVWAGSCRPIITHIPEKDLNASAYVAWYFLFGHV